MKRTVISTLSILLLLCVLSAQVFAATLDVNRTGSVSIAMKHEGTVVPGGSLTLYRVGSVAVKNGATYLTDMNAANGTFVNGVKVLPNQEIALKTGDKIKLADEEFEFRA